MQTLHPKLYVPAAHAVGASVVACALLAYYALVHLPLDRQQASDMAQGDLLQQGLHGSLEVRRDHLQLTRHLEKLNQLIEQARQTLPESSAESLFLAKVTQVADAEVLKLDDFRRAGQQTIDRHTEVWVVIHGSGSHAGISRFLDKMGEFPHAAILTELEINSTDDPIQYSFQATYTLYHNASLARTASDSQHTTR